MTTTGIPHDYTPLDLHHLTVEALSADRWKTTRDYDERYAAAWHAIACTLITALQPPTHTDLLNAGVRASHQALRDTYRAHGHDRDHGRTRPRFYAYWDTAADHTPGPEDALVEHHTFLSVWRALAPEHRETLAAYAFTATQREAGATLGVSRSGLAKRLHRARTAALALWHEHETPRPVPSEHRTGARSGMWKGQPRLTESQVDALRDRYHTGTVTYAELAAELGVNPGRLSELIRGVRRAAPDRPAT